MAAFYKSQIKDLSKEIENLKSKKNFELDYRKHGLDLSTNSEVQVQPVKTILNPLDLRQNIQLDYNPVYNPSEYKN